MKKSREEIFGWTVYGISFVGMFLIVNDYNDGEDSYSIIRVLARAAAYTLWPGYSVILAVHLWLHKIRPSLLFISGMCSILAGLLLFGLPLPEPRVMSDLLAIVLFFGGHPMIVPFVVRIWELDLNSRDGG